MKWTNWNSVFLREQWKVTILQVTVRLKPFPIMVCVCWGEGKRDYSGEKSYRSGFLTWRGSGTDKYNKWSMFTKNVCEDYYYLVLCICFPTTEEWTPLWVKADTHQHKEAQRGRTHQKHQLSRKQKATSTQEPKNRSETSWSPLLHI